MHDQGIIHGDLKGVRLNPVIAVPRRGLLDS